MMTRALVMAVALVATAYPALAQQKLPIGPFVVDARVSSAGLPNQPGWTPAVPSATVTPGRGRGLEVGGHVHVVRLRSIALGVGATWLVARGSAAPPDVTGTLPPPALPAVTTRVTSFAPQISLNFGHSLGWSYLSAGLGRSKAESEATAAGATFVPRESGWVKTLNYGGGARWFITDHLGVGFDLRWHKVSLVPATATHPGAPRASLLVAGAGIVLK